MKGTTGNAGPGPVIVGVGGSEPGRRAALGAATEATRRDSPLRIVYAADTVGRVLHLPAERIERVRGGCHELLRETAAASRKWSS
ncbi:hypothetical protein ACFCZY_32730 [Streptomyces sp. NPDC056237]|uniref:hypothetical protein n=1 Tax=unclassified Streptomyces TaxID=2593676 RepID=UPI0035DE1D3B